MSDDKNKEWVDNYVDFHCHPSIKPFGKSFKNKPVGQNTSHRSKRNSIWKYDPPSLGDKLTNFLIGLTKFSQANFTSMARGGISIVCVSLYPMEKWFFVNAINDEFIRDIASNFATGVSKRRVDTVQGMTNYFKDLELQYDFYKQLDGKVIKLPEGQFKYKLVNNNEEIETIKKEKSNVTTICVILTIEGMHALNDNLNVKPNTTSFLSNLNKIKQWEAAPFFVTFAHHFWNHLCGHAESFSGIVKKNVDQSQGLDTGFTNLGYKVLDSLLSTKNGKRILIDIKHMSIQSRIDFYKIIDTTSEYKNLPIIVSHGAANGLQSFKEKTHKGSSVAKKLNPVTINFFNEEIIRIAKSKGVIGLQLDERRVVNSATLKKVKHSIKRSKIMHYRSELLWYQIQHIIELLDSEGLFAWDCIVIGSDFDGIIDPLNSFWTAEELPFLADFLERHAHNYVQKATFKVSKNNIEADDIVSRIMSLNGMRFFKENFK